MKLFPSHLHDILVRNKCSIHTYIQINSLNLQISVAAIRCLEFRLGNIDIYENIYIYVNIYIQVHIYIYGNISTSKSRNKCTSINVKH